MGPSTILKGAGDFALGAGTAGYCNLIHNVAALQSPSVSIEYASVGSVHTNHRTVHIINLPIQAGCNQLTNRHAGSFADLRSARK